MKFPISLLVFTSNLAIVFARGPIIFGDRFSRTTIEKWRVALQTDGRLAKRYSKSIKVLKENQKNLKAQRCPDDLKGVDIALFQARGFHHRQKTRGKDWNGKTIKDLSWELAESTGDLNDVRFVYNLNSGDCGVIEVKTAKETSFFLPTAYRWQEPEFKDGTQMTAEDVPSRPISTEQLKLSPLEAMQKGIEKVPNLKNGFMELELGQTHLYKRIQPVYIFKGLQDNPFEAVYVSADDGKAIFYTPQW